MSSRDDPFPAAVPRLAPPVTRSPSIPVVGGFASDQLDHFIDPPFLPRHAPSTQFDERVSLRESVLILGVYLANRSNHISQIVRNNFASRDYQVTQCWIAIGGESPDSVVRNVTVEVHPDPIPKFTLLSRLLSQIQISQFEYVILMDDDIVLPDGFLDNFLRAQSCLEFGLAQPARTPGSYYDHLFAVQVPGLFARETRWVEIGPVVSIHRSIYDCIFPFDLSSPMGWGHENVWAYELARRGCKIGMLDAFPVDHSLRQQAAFYNWHDADCGRRELLKRRAHLTDQECQVVLTRHLDWPASSSRSSSRIPMAESVSLTQIKALLDDQSTTTQEPCAVLDWFSGIELSQLSERHIVFSTVDSTDRHLPYFSKSVEMVAIGPASSEMFREACRIARLAVIQSEGAGQLRLLSLSPISRSPRPTFSVVIPTFNGEAFVERILAGLLPTLDRSFDVEVLIVDDASTDGTRACVAAWAMRDARVIFVASSGQNENYVHTCNRGARIARGDFLVFLNNDAIPQPGWLNALWRTFQMYPDAGAVGGKLVYPDGRLQEAGGMVFADGSAANFGNGDHDLNAPRYVCVRDVDYCSGAFLATPSRLFAQFGGFDARYAPAYYEDTDYCFKLREAGYRVLYQPECVVVHLEGGTCGTDVSRGTKQYQQRNQAVFRERWNSVLDRHALHPARFDWGSQPPQTKQSSRYALVCSPLLPEFDRESGSRRIFNHIQTLVKQGWTVVFAAKQGDSNSRYARLLRQLGVETHCGFEQLDSTVLARRFEIALLAFWENAESILLRIRRLTPNTRVIVDSIDLHFLRNARRLLGDWQPQDSARLPPQLQYEMQRELAVYRAADLVLTVSLNESEILSQVAREVRPFVVPDGCSLTLSTVPSSERRGLLFLGNFRHSPNAEAVVYLCQHVLPLVDPLILQKHPVFVVGNDLPADIRGFAAHQPYLQMVGWVPTIWPYLANAKMMLAPLLHGAGTKRKLIESFMVGSPVIGTSIAAEGLPVRHGEHLLVADTPKAFAAAITQLISDDRLSQSLAIAGRAAIAPRHSEQASCEALISAIQVALDPIRLTESR